MRRFLANTENSVDKKGRVSVPAAFRSVLGGNCELYTMLSISGPTVEAGGPQLIEAAEARLAQMDPFSEEYEVWSYYIHGDSNMIKIDGDGRIKLGDEIREHTGISHSVVFVGRGHFFQMWDPEKFKTYQKETRLKAEKLRRRLGRSGGGIAVEGKH